MGSLSSTYQINGRLNNLMEDLQIIPSQNSIHVAMDMEWSVDRSNGIHGRVALITVAYQRYIYLIPVAKYVENNFLKLPYTLLVLLRSPQVHKVGVHIKADFTRLYKDCEFDPTKGDTPFVGAVELGAMAKERKLTELANVSLTDLMSIVLHRYLLKDESIRVSTAWDNPELTPEQVSYASLDVYAAWSIFETFSTVSVGQAVTDATSAGTKVKLMSRDRNSIVAYGIITPDRPKKFNSVNVSKTRVIVNITAILQLGYLVRADLLSSKVDIPITQFGNSGLPFQLLCYMKDLQTCSNNDDMLEPPIPSQTAPLPVLPFVPSKSTYEPTQDASGSLEDCSPVTGSNGPCGENSDFYSWHNDLDFDPDVEGSAQDAEHDPSAARHAEHLLNTMPALGEYEAQTIRSWVLGDIWHLMDQFKIPLHHGMRRPFARALHDALLLPDPNDKSAIEEVLSSRGITWDQMVLWKSDWVWQRVRRLVPPPEILLQRVTDVFDACRPAVDATTRQPLFNEASWEKARNVLENIRLRYYSDPPGVKMYIIDRTDGDGLTVYRCIRGTNNVEGDQTADAFVPMASRGSLTGWINGDDYEQTNENFGILPLSSSARKRLAMQEYDAEFAKKEKIRHQHLAMQQRTQIPILPLHTAEERALYRMLVKQPGGHFAGKTQPNWVSLARDWSRYCNGVHVFYKLPEHLKNYHKTWNEIRNKENSVEQHKDAYIRIQNALVAPPISISTIPT
ncbi:hypothetical protein SCP_0202180 [Sparassis crispa]|uniref:3'-5' exonuclease n=1 Tax=Sparassis crispa TaxID=139825 RepID=A0A401GA37_9APHY|nr:hypothetical protein SCP_0202180 [Sparassis crispa]GBE79021.1 hypothetical protein SCP_0202180 [Sparassis crispa]